MADNVITKPLGLVLIATAHMVFGPGGAEVIGTLGNNITLTFTFNETAINYNSHFAVYLNDRKIAEYTGHRRFMLGDVFDIYQNTSVRYHISKLYLNKSGSYRMTLFQDSTKLKESDNEVHLTVLRGNTSSTVGPLQENITTTTRSESSTFALPTDMIFVLVISLFLLTVALFSLLIWCLVRVKARQQQYVPQQNSNTTTQDTINISNSPPQPPLVYSVLDFPKRPAATSVNSDNTEYANISYVSEKMHSSMQT
ncbi:uncharacterized protein LOC103395684 isoform X1 [Cynoglossus semilaevis]|uniref:uncharacterized protein LOC103395684 isoform X1 n=1 Tax=Cynoglossus semilaevis TaxID=244447 RepID=UPI0007DCAEE7|nr:uncharacterized protein LOC103395684 isoform X1 [Cynoglossus semilaevis]